MSWHRKWDSRLVFSFQFSSLPDLVRNFWSWSPPHHSQMRHFWWFQITFRNIACLQYSVIAPPGCTILGYLDENQHLSFHLRKMNFICFWILHKLEYELKKINHNKVTMHSNITAIIFLSVTNWYWSTGLYLFRCHAGVPQGWLLGTLQQTHLNTSLIGWFPLILEFFTLLSASNWA